jgi:hypothetical protein
VISDGLIPAVGSSNSKILELFHKAHGNLEEPLLTER